MLNISSLACIVFNTIYPISSLSKMNLFPQKFISPNKNQPIFSYLSRSLPKQTILLSSLSSVSISSPLASQSIFYPSPTNIFHYFILTLATPFFFPIIYFCFEQKRFGLLPFQQKDNSFVQNSSQSEFVLLIFFCLFPLNSR